MWEETPPQTGTSLPFIWPPPDHLQTPPPFQEPVLPCPPPESLLAREMKLDALRCEDPSKHQGVQVYDSLSRPPRVDYPDARGATVEDEMPRWYVPSGPDDDTVVFESRFESGNLRSAERIDEWEYNLHLAFDINTDRHTQWFYFRMSNLRKGRPYKLNMQNLMKTEAVYNLGMQPLAYSEARAQQEGVGWYRTGTDACYFKNQLTRAGAKPFWTLTFVVKTEFDQDTLYLAHCFPYRYTDLQRYLSELESSPLGVSCAIRRRTLCETLAGNVCDLLTITSPGGRHDEKKGIVISARVHPGETNASWMMKGVLDYLGSDCHCAVALRNKFVFKIVPMLNPDGVIVGNYRCSLAGSDLNRQYEEPKRELFPEVMNLKQMISNFSIGKEVLLFVDLHGHSKKSNIFMYGVENPTDEALYMRERVIPTLLHQASPLFNMGDCTFDIGKGKEGCGRVVVRRQLGIVNAYTMEASFMGADQGEFQGVHFHQGHYEAMGHSLCEVLLDLVDTDQSKVEGIVQKLKDKFPIDQSRVVSKQDGYGDRYGGRGDDSSSSTSSDDSDNPSHGRQRHRLVPRPPSSKPSSPSARPSSPSAARWRKISQHVVKGAVVDGASSGGTSKPPSSSARPGSSAGRSKKISQQVKGTVVDGASSGGTSKPSSPSARPGSSAGRWRKISQHIRGTVVNGANSGSTSKPSSPSARPGSSSARWRKISQHIRGTVVNGASSGGGAGGGTNEKGKGQTPRSARSESTHNSKRSEQPSPAAKAPPSPRTATPSHKSHATTTSTPSSSSKDSGAGNTAVKNALAKSSGSKISARRLSYAAGSSSSRAPKQQEKEQEKDTDKDKDKAPSFSRSVTSGARLASPQNKGKATPRAGSGTAAPTGDGATTVARGGSTKPAVGNKKPSKVAAVPSRVLARGDTGAGVTAAANGKKAPKASAKAKGAPTVSPHAPAHRPKSSPAPRSVSSPRRTAAPAEAPRRTPSAPPKAGLTRAHSSGGTKAKRGGGGTAGGNRKNEVLPLPPLKSKTKKTIAHSPAGR